MKFTTLLLIVSMMQVSASSFAQRISLSKKNAPLIEVFNQIRLQSGYDFVFNASTLKSSKQVSIEVKNEELKVVLSKLFEGQPFEFSIEDKTVIVTKKEVSMIEAMKERVKSFFENIDVRGKVVDSLGMPLPGASVMVKGSSKGVRTNEKGDFYLQNVDDKATVLISYLGYETREIKAGKDLGVLTMVLATGKLQEVTVSTGYQTLPKERATGSFEVIDNKLFNRTTGTNVLPRLMATVPGLLTRGENPNDITIRGVTTFSSPSPLIILDNMPFEGDVNNINPNDVENITILKDAAAASIWGVRAGNGVIVITTKKGRFNQSARVSINSNTTITDKPDLFSRPELNSSGVIEVERFLFNQGFYDGALSATDQPPFLTPAVELMAKQRALPVGDLQGRIALDKQINNLASYDIRNDFLKYVYRKSVNQQYSVNLNGGSDQIAYNFSGGYDRNLNSFVNSSNNRITLNSNVSVKPVKNLEISTQLFYTNAKGKEGNTPKLSYQYGRLVDDYGNPVSLRRDYRVSFVDSLSKEPHLLSLVEKPLDEMNKTIAESNSNDLLLRLGAKYKFNEIFSAELNYQNQRVNNYSTTLNQADSYVVRQMINTFTDPITYNRSIPLGAFYNSGSSVLSSQTVRATLNADKTWANKHQLFVIAGAEAKKNTNQSYDYGTKYGYEPSTETFLSVDTKNPQFQYFGGNGLIPYTPSIGRNDNRFTSVFTNGSYTYLNRYTVSGSVRKDASNVFGDNANKQGSPLWSGGLSWRIDEESFFNVKSVDLLKFRVTYGYSGNVAVGGVAYSVARYEGNDRLTGLNYASSGNAPNPDLRWEKVGQLNLGLDFGLVKNRISGSVEYFVKNSTDIVAQSPLDLTTGFRTQIVNSASLKGKGIDLTLSSININTSEFQWQTNLTFSYNKVLVTKNKDKLSTFQYVTGANGFNPIEGKDAYALYAYRSAGLDPTNGNPRGYLNGVASDEYDQLINTDISDLEYYGSSVPRQYGALRNTFSYKNIELSCNIMYKLDYFFRRLSLSYSDLFGSGSGNKEFANRWMKPGDEAFTEVPSLIYSLPNYRDAFYAYSTSTIEKGDHIRIQDITASYGFSKIKGLKQLRVYGNINNIGIVWRANKRQLDPDYFGQNRPVQSYAIGLKADF